MLYKNKNIVEKLKNQNGGLIQYGGEYIFYFSAILILWLGRIDFILL
jgi:hypothetical protein